MSNGSEDSGGSGAEGLMVLKQLGVSDGDRAHAMWSCWFREFKLISHARDQSEISVAL